MPQVAEHLLQQAQGPKFKLQYCKKKKKKKKYTEKNLAFFFFSKHVCHYQKEMSLGKNNKAL
jgi:hypothetical protein